MVRPQRKKQTPKKYDTESFILDAKLNSIPNKTSPVIKNGKKSSARQEFKKKDAVNVKRSSPRYGLRKSNKSKDNINTLKDDRNIDDLKINLKNESKKSNSNDESTKISSDNESGKINSTDESQAKPVRKENKFFKSKRLAADVKKEKQIVVEKKMTRKRKSENDSHEEIKKKLNTPMRQTTLSESFRRSSVKKRLRPRKEPVKYKDDTNNSLLLEKSISPDKRKSVVLLNRMDEANVRNKPPIYKALEILEDRKVGDKDSVYDFQIDPGERRAKVKKKRAPKRPATNKKKKTKIVAKVAPQVNNEASAKLSVNIKTVAPPAQVENEPKEIENVYSSERVIEIEPASELAVMEPEKPVQKENVEGQKRGVRISRVEVLTGDRKVSFKPNLSLTGQNSAKFNPFRSTQSIFKPRPTLNAKDMMDHSLFNKSLSPIKGETDQFDPASPWRPPMSGEFSTVKRVVQSTPQIRKTFGRVTAGFRIDENDENQEARAPKMSTNPLGLKISNTDNIEALNARKVDGLLPQEINSSIVKIGSGKTPLGPSSNYGDNKMNLGYGDRLYRSPKKSDNGSLALNTSVVSPAQKKKRHQITSEEETMEDNENSPPLEEESRILKQSNLNTFLNLEEMPESIRINTSHGIFSDSPCSTSIVKTQVPKIQPPANVENCFGFEEEISDVQVSPLKPDKKTRQEKAPIKKLFNRLKDRVLPVQDKNTARISLGEIKNILYPRREKKTESSEQKEERNEEKENALEPKSRGLINSVRFSDTFDITSETNQDEGQEKSTGPEIALFVDLEPVHFTKPPRWSYAKKRERKNCLPSDEEEEDDFESIAAPVTKKRKVGKLNKADEKKIEDWVNSVNETFQEIDDFDLVIEKAA